MTYLEYRHRIEFGLEDYRQIDAYCKEKKIAWFASCWDEPSVDFMAQFNPTSYFVTEYRSWGVPALRWMGPLR